MRIGVFDSGIGGEALAESLKGYFPAADIRTVNDHDNVPYGSKSAEQITALTNTAIQPLLSDERDVIVIACNSATMAAIDTLRQKYPMQHFIGLEPMVKPAAKLTKTGVIAVCATPLTLSSTRYQWLLANYAQNIRVVQPDCSEWARMIEGGAVQREKVEAAVVACVSQGADVIVLGCTHYHWIKDLITEIAGEGVTILEPSEAIARRVRGIVATKNTWSVIDSHQEVAPTTSAAV